MNEASGVVNWSRMRDLHPRSPRPERGAVAAGPMRVMVGDGRNRTSCRSRRPGYSRMVAPATDRHPLNWYPRFDSNEHCRRSERRDSCRLVYAGMVRTVRVELTLDRLSTCCLCHWATCAIWFRAQVSNLDLSAFKAQRPRRQLARIENGCPRRFRTSCFPRSERGGRTNQLRGIDTGAGHRI